MRRALLLGWLLLLAATVTPPSPVAAQAATFTVTSPADPGDGLCDATCTLRDAILAANAAGPGARIEFALTGDRTIRPVSELPRITAFGVLIDGRTQPGFTGAPLIALDGGNATDASGLVSIAAGVEIRALAIGGFDRFGIAISSEDADGNHVLGNWVGLGLDGTTARPNRLSGIAVLSGADGARIGDRCADCGNRIAGNSGPDRTGHGVLIAGSGTSGAVVAGNVIGLDVGGAPLPNDDGVLIVDQAGATVGGRSLPLRNVISGNRVAGVEVRETALLDVRIEGNLIGLDADGRRARGNDVGVFLNEGATNVTIGVAQAAIRNVISGNRVGVAIEQRAEGVTLQANDIGLTADGAAVVGNTEAGLSIIAGARDVQIGGRFTDQGNWIAGNETGVVIAGTATRGVVLEGNQIGRVRVGEAVGASGAGNGVGIAVAEAAAIMIGGPGVGNTIVASDGPGVRLADVQGVVIEENGIGVLPDGELVGNAVGIALEDGALDAQIERNQIGGSAGAGVTLVGARTQRNRLHANSFRQNAGLSVDLNDDGPSPDGIAEGDPPNGGAAPPVIETVEHSGVISTARGTARRFGTVQLYRVESALTDGADTHPSGFGAATEFLGRTRADASGAWELRVAIGQPGPLTALVVDSRGNTSEAARNVAPPQPVRLQGGFTAVGWFGPATAVEDAFAALGPRLEAAYRFDATTQQWRIYRPGFPFLSDLSTLAPGDALWVQLTAGGAVDWHQPADAIGARALALQPGVNFVTWTGPPTAVDDAVAALGVAVERVVRLNPDTGQFDALVPRTPLPGIARTLSPRDPLWIWVDRAVTWEQPTP